jgi:hypothetical protein
METNAIEQWLTATLKADAQLATKVSTRVFNTRRTDKTLPCVLFQMQSPGNDLVMLGGVRVWAAPLYAVYGLAEQASYEGDLATIANRIDAVLHAKSGINAAGTIWTCVRERPFQMAEVFEGREVRRLGGLYRIQAR